MSLRIGIDISKALGPRDGIADYSLELFRSLTNEAATDEEILAFTGNAQSDEPDQAALDSLGSAVEILSRWPTSDDRLDIYHCTSFRVPSGLEARLFFTIYDLTFLDLAELHTLDNKLHCLNGLLRAALAGSTFVAISKASRDALLELLALPEEDRVPVVPPGIAGFIRSIDSAEARARIRQRFGITGEFVLHVGTAEPRKNRHRLLEAHRMLEPDLRRDYPLVCAGGAGWLVDDLGEQPALHQLGRVSNEDLVALYNAATVFAYPSLAEGFGLPVAEAMKCGAPVVTSDRSSLPEVAGDAAALVDPFDVRQIADTLAMLLTTPAKRDELSAKGKARSDMFSWAQGARTILELYRATP